MPPITLLMIEDCRLVRVGLRAVLEGDPDLNMVGEVDNGEMGVALAKELHPDVVLIDLGLPGMSGVETIYAIKNNQSHSNPSKFIVLTTHEQEKELFEALEAGAQAYCLKNIAGDRLIEVIKSVYDGAVWLDPGMADFALKRLTQSEATLFERPCNEPLLNSLTERECSILQLLVQGKSNTAIAQELYISVHTVKFYVSSLLEKLAVTDRVQAAVKAVQQGLVTLSSLQA